MWSRIRAPIRGAHTESTYSSTSIDLILSTRYDTKLFVSFLRLIINVKCYILTLTLGFNIVRLIKLQ
jgi:hypothetical protein